MKSGQSAALRAFVLAVLFRGLQAEDVYWNYLNASACLGSLSVNVWGADRSRSKNGSVEYEVEDGRPLVLECSGVCKRPALLQWSCRTQNDVEIVSYRDTMTMDPVPRDLRDCACMVTGAEGRSLYARRRVAFRVSPQSKLTLSSSMPDWGGIVSMKEGSYGLSLFCLVTGVDLNTMEVEWLKNDLPLNSHFFTLPFLTAMKRTDSGVYKCIYRTAKGILSASVRVAVIPHPKELDTSSSKASVITGSVFAVIIVIIIVVLLVVFVPRYLRRGSQEAVEPDKEKVIDEKY